MVYLMESYIKTVTLVCVWRFGKESAEEGREYRVLSLGLDGYMKVYDYGRMKVTYSMRFLHLQLCQLGFRWIVG